MHKTNADVLALAALLKAIVADPKALFVTPGPCHDAGAASATAAADFVLNFSRRLQQDISDEVTLSNVANLLFR
ncbi:hypothetical protein [Chromobacterium haemolyticum]|uniref:hypothetical protein n=1 Tax=Chromobacterium haemolyticum TaxID=394935 RepID=UPI000594686B|nr:hypothetical protein [Chromobacterium haemolyticum]BBH14551.1 hypothetical protein CH06BL_37990 [Chromobacterium haemolyticum]